MLQINHAGMTFEMDEDDLVETMGELFNNLAADMSRIGSLPVVEKASGFPYTVDNGTCDLIL